MSWHSQQGAVVLLLWPVLCCVMLMLLGFDTSYKTRGCERANQQPTARCKSWQASTACMPRPLAPSTRCCTQGLDLSRPASYTGVLLPSGTPCQGIPRDRPRLRNEVLYCGWDARMLTGTVWLLYVSPHQTTLHLSCRPWQPGRLGQVGACCVKAAFDIQSDLSSSRRVAGCPLKHATGA